tara:strand:- start:443 stop:1336 length:894 start_codon:yes stop_codon:yes gene_type:complete
MAVPSSGQLRLRGDIALEINGNATGLNVSLRSLSALAGKSSPDSMSEFYGYSSVALGTPTTYNSEAVGEYSFRAAGTIQNAGGGTVLDKGFYIGANSSSPIYNTKHSVGSGLGVYYFNKSASPNTTYYVWAYMTNEAGTSYGSRITTTTIASFSPVLFNHVNQNSASFFSAAGDFNGSSDYFTNGYRNPYTGAFVTVDAQNPYAGGTQYMYSAGWRYCINAPNFTNVYHPSCWAMFNIRVQGNVNGYGHYYVVGSRYSIGNSVFLQVQTDSFTYLRATNYPSDPPAVTNLGMVYTIN